MNPALKRVLGDGRASIIDLLLASPKPIVLSEMPS